MSKPSRLTVGAQAVFERAARALTYSIERLARDLGVTPGTLFNYRKGRTRATNAALQGLGRVLRRQVQALEERYREVVRLRR